MKVETSSTPTHASGMEKSRAFHFEFNKMMFKTLSSTTYSDPIRAVIRELACNSSDAHTMAGQTKPFEIQLPTIHTPEFAIRDFGTGMDDQEINDLFTMYGGSNKRENNQTIGALGIGSKSPYSYTDMYTVVTTKDGITRTYVAHVEDGMPRLTPGSVVKNSKAPNGVTVQFAVKEKDIWEFENKAKVALEFFEPMPKVKGNNQFAPHKQTYVLQGKSWGLRKDAGTAAHGYGCRAIMGKVQYQVGDIDESRTNSLQKKILAMPIDMFFELGDLTFQASRESLVTSGTDGEKTLTAILRMCNDILDEAIQSVRAKINACKDIWDAQVYLFSILNQTNNSVGYGGGMSMSALIREALEKGKLYGQYANFKLMESKAVINFLDYNHISVTTFEHNTRSRRNGGSARRASKEPLFIGHEPTIREDRRLAKTGDPLAVARNRREIVVRPEAMFVINDTKRAADKYLNYYIQEAENSTTMVYLVHLPKTSTVEIATMVKNANKLIRNLGNPPVVLLSELVSQYASVFASLRAAAGPRAKSHKVAVLRDELPYRVRSTQTGWTKAWREMDTEEAAETGKKFYVAINKLVAINAGFDDAWDLLEFVNYVRGSGRFGINAETPIYGIKHDHKLLKENKGEWVELLHHVYSRVNDIMTPQKTQALSLFLKPFTDDLRDLLSHLADKQPLTNSPAQMFAVALEDAKSVRFENWSTFKWILDFCVRRGKYSYGKTTDFNTKWGNIKKDYPMLQFVNHGRNDKTILVDYIRQVDEQNERQTLALAAASNQ